MKHHQHPVIALTGGGSGGHITPILSLAHELKLADPHCQIVYIGHKGDSFDNMQSFDKDFDFMAFINAGKFRRYHGEGLLSHLLDVKTLALNIRDFFRVIKSVGSAMRVLNRTGPDVLFVKGGFVSVPVGIAARLKRIPIITHDSDTVGGLANRIVGRWAAVHATGMPPEYYKFSPESIAYVGIPLDRRIKYVTPMAQKDLKKELELPEDAQMLLVAGGGLGSKKINDLITDVAGRLLKANLSLQIVHIAGAQHLSEVKAKYQALSAELRARVTTLDFTADFYKYSGAADLIISRAGATALAEFAAQGKACVVIPSPFLTGGHQLKNAQTLAQQDAAVIVDENVAADEIIGLVNELMSNDHRRWQLSQNIRQLAKPGASQKLAKIVLELAKK